MMNLSFGPVSVSDFDNMDTSLLRIYAKQHGLSQAGPKQALVARCKASLSTQSTVGTTTQAAPVTAPAELESILICNHPYGILGDRVLSIGTPPEGLKNEYPVITHNGERFVHRGGVNWHELPAARPQPQAATLAPVVPAEPKEGIDLYVTPADKAFTFAKQNPDTPPVYGRLRVNSRFGTTLGMYHKAEDGELRPNKSHMVRFPRSADLATLTGQFNAWWASELANAIAVAPK